MLFIAVAESESERSDEKPHVRESTQTRFDSLQPFCRLPIYLVYFPGEEEEV